MFSVICGIKEKNTLRKKKKTETCKRRREWE
jgi:hypothetical protein